MTKTVLALLAVAVVLASQASVVLASQAPAFEVCLEAYLDAGAVACGGSPTFITVVNGVCFDVNPDEGPFSSITANCVSNTAGSAWDIDVWSTSDTCTGMATAADFNGGTGEFCATTSGTNPNIPKISKLHCQGSCAALGLRVAASCFSGTGTVRVQDAVGLTPMSKVQIGDKVLASDSEGHLFYDKVFRITHHQPDTTAEFVQLTTEGGKELQLSGNHYLHVNGCCDLNKMTKAEDVKKGDTLFVVADSATVPETVLSVSRVRTKGVFNVHTLSGQIIVNDVAASHFTTESHWSDSSKGSATLWYQLLDKFSPMFGTQDASRD